MNHKLKAKAKTERNSEIFDYKIKHPDCSYQDIGTVFNISRQRVHQILSGYKSPDFYTSIMYEHVHRMGNHQCPICGKKKKLIVHHIDGNDRNNKPNNLTSMCVSCHAKLHNLGKKKAKQ